MKRFYLTLYCTNIKYFILLKLDLKLLFLLPNVFIPMFFFESETFFSSQKYSFTEM